MSWDVRIALGLIVLGLAVPISRELYRRHCIRKLKGPKQGPRHSNRHHKHEGRVIGRW